MQQISIPISDESIRSLNYQYLKAHPEVRVLPDDAYARELQTIASANPAAATRLEQALQSAERIGFDDGSE